MAERDTTTKDELIELFLKLYNQIPDGPAKAAIYQRVQRSKANGGAA